MKVGLQIVKGDATLPKFTTNDPAELRVIIHVCNNLNRWGKGFVVPLGDRYPAAKNIYLKSASQNGYHELGSITYCQIDPTLMVVNMVAQKGISKDPLTGEMPIRYPALIECLRKIRQIFNDEFKGKTVSIHMPKIGCGLAGGDWDVVSEIINAELVVHGYSCVVYVL